MKKKFLIFTSLLLPMTFLTGCGEDDVDPNRRLETTFKNYNQEVLYYNTVAYGGTATYQGPTPTRPSSGGTSYYFSGWDKPLENITSDTTFIAQYTTTPTTFQITWNNYDGTLLAKTSVEYGKLPAYTGKTPTKPSTADYKYTFTGWSPEVVEATENATYTAVFEEEEIIKPTNKVELSVVYSVYNPKSGQPIAVYQTKPSDLGSVSVTDEYDKGTDVRLYASPFEGYTFVGWYYDGHLLSDLENYNFRVWDKDEEVEARFKYTLYDFTLSSSNADFGTVSIGGNYYTSTTTQKMFYTEEIDLYALAKDEIRFIGWYTADNDLISNNAVYKISMPNHEYSVISKWNKFFITYNLNGGSISSSLLQNYSYPDSGTKYYYLPTPTKTGYLFQNWLVNGEYSTYLDESLLCDFYVEAIWSPIHYTIQFDGNGSTSGSMSSMYMTYDIADNLYSNSFLRSGYTFTGWNTRKDGFGTSYEDQESVTNLTAVDGKTITLYAQWEANNYNATLYSVSPYEDITSKSYTVTFDSNGGSEVASQTVTETDSLYYPSIPTREGYAFSGWYKESYTMSLYDFTETITSDLTLYAGWTEMVTSYYGRYNINALEYSDSYNAFSTNNLYSSGSYTYVYFTAFNTETINFYYRNDYSSSYYRIYYLIHDVTVGSDLSSGSTYDTYFDSTSLTITEGHVYYIRLYKYSSSYNPTFYCYFTGMTARKAGGNAGYKVFATYSVTYGSSYNFLTPDDVPGCNFIGWYDIDGNQYTDGSGYYVDVWKSAEDVKLYPKWDYVEYSLKYELDGGTNSKNNPSSYIVKDNITLEDPTKAGYEFDGWYLESYFVNQITEIKYGNYYEDLTLYAKWSAKKVNATLVVNELEFNKPSVVSFDSNGGTEVASQSVTMANPLTYPSIPTKEGYAFKGWYEDSNLTTLYDFTKDVTSDITLYAGWSAMTSSYYARSYINATSYNSSSSTYSTSSLSTSGNYTYVYFTAFNTETINFYYRNSNSSSSYYRVYYYIYDVTADLSITSGSTYSIGYNYYSFTVTEGHVYYMRLYKYSSSYYPTFDCYFSGLTPRAAGGQGTIVTHTYNVEQVSYDSSYNLSHEFTRKGYEFIGWYDENDVQYTDKDGNGVSSWTSLEDVELYAKWKKAVYSITYVLDGGTNSESNPTTYDMDDSFNLSDPSKYGNTFGGWYLEDTFETKVTSILGEDYCYDLTLYAKWVPITSKVTLVASDADSWDSVTITFNANGGATPESQTVSKNTSIQYPFTYKSGYAFNGWYEDPELTTLYDFTKQVTHDMTLYAGWTEMESSYYSKTIFEPAEHTTQSSAYGVYLSSSDYSYYYFTAYNTETINFYYRNNYSSSSYTAYFDIYDVTADSNVVSGSTYSTSYSSTSFTVTEGHVYYMRLYKYSTSYSPTFYCYFEGANFRAAGGYGPDENVYREIDVSYNTQIALPHGCTRDGYRFVGWFDINGNQYTDENGNLLTAWELFSDVTLYAHWELIE